MMIFCTDAIPPSEGNAVEVTVGKVVAISVQAGRLYENYATTLWYRHAEVQCDDVIAQLMFSTILTIDTL